VTGGSTLVLFAVWPGDHQPAVEASRRHGWTALAAAEGVTQSHRKWPGPQRCGSCHLRRFAPVTARRDECLLGKRNGCGGSQPAECGILPAGGMSPSTTPKPVNLLDLLSFW